MRKSVFILSILMLTATLPSAAAANTSQTLDAAVPDTTHVYSAVSTYTDIPITGTTVQEFVCGYSVDRTTRGDDCGGKSVSEAPGERWFRLSIPAGSMGNEMRINVENLDDPHKVDLEIDFCRTNSITLSEIQCFDRNDMYGDVNQNLYLQPIFSNEYWVHVTAHDEEKEGRSPGGDLTKVRLSLNRNIDSNGDRQEPELLIPGQELPRKVCERTCETPSEIDPIDVFKIEGLAGDEIEVAFGSREDDVVGHYDLLVYYNHEVDFYDSSKSTKAYAIDDSCNYDSPAAGCVSTLSYTFETSGYLLIWFIALGEPEGYYENEAESYTIEYKSQDTTFRSQTADRDGDGLPDAEEDRCGSDFRDPSSTASDFDGDNICDDHDNDDDNDGIEDLSDPCRFSTSTTDYDNDGCDDGEDSDDDNDGILDNIDVCPTGEIGTHSATEDMDGDGCANSEDEDDDGDGWYDDEELECSSDPLDQSDFPADWDIDYENYVFTTTGQDIFECDIVDDDDDQDSIPDTVDACQFSEWFQITPQWTFVQIDEDLDGDGCFNEEDFDDDGDSILDNADSCPQGLSTGPDFDGDGCKDAEDSDIDNDGHENEYEEACGTSPMDASSIPIGTEFDADLDGICDAVDDDDDNDGVVDSSDRFPFDSSENQDTDGDGIGNNADTDDDGDNVVDIQDAFPLDPNEQTDTDADGTGNNADSDDDGDSWSDAEEVNCQTNPLDGTSRPTDIDGDKICDFLDDDKDNDDFSNIAEENCDSDPEDVSSTPQNFDGDGKCDTLDDDDDNDGIPDNDPSGSILDACPFTPTKYVGTKDTDGDGCFDLEPLELDDDGDLVPDAEDNCQLTFAKTEDGCPETSFLEANSSAIYAGVGLLVLILVLVGAFNIINIRSDQHAELQSQRIAAEAGVSKTNITNTVDQSVRVDNSKKMVLSQLSQQTVNRNKSFSNVLNAEKNSNVVSHGTNFNDTGDEQSEL